MKNFKEYLKSLFPGSSKYITVLVVPEGSERMRTFRIKRAYIGWVFGIFAFLVAFFFSQFFVYPYFIKRISSLGGNVAQLKIVRAKMSSLEGELNDLRELKRKLAILMGLKNKSENAQEPILPLTSVFFNKETDKESIPSGLPAKGFVSTKFGDITPFFKYPHTGVDIVLPRGSFVRSTAGGRVSKVYYDPSLGNTVEIDHKNGYVSRYCHLEKALVSQGDEIIKGKIIGLSGSTGKSFGPHLHYEVLFEGTPVDPLSEGGTSVGKKGKE